MNSLPVRLFHAFLAGAAFSVLIALGILQIGQIARADTGGGGSTTSGSSNNSTPSVAPPTVLNPTPDDLDGDGMPNTWETQFHHDPNNATDAGLDFDNDGLTAKQEYLTGTNPLGKWHVQTITLPGLSEYPPGGQVSWTATSPNSSGEFGVSRKVYDPATSLWTSELLVYKPQEDALSPIPVPGNSDDYLEVCDINDVGTLSIYRENNDGSIQQGYFWRPGQGYEELLDENGQAAVAWRLNNWDDWIGWSTADWSPASSNYGVVTSEAPLGVYWEFTDINDYGETMGTYNDPIDGPRTFLEQDGWFFLTGLPGQFPFFDQLRASWTYPAAINNWGEFAGYATGSISGQATYRSYVFDGDYQEINVDGQTTSGTPVGIDATGRAVTSISSPNVGAPGVLFTRGVGVHLKDLAPSLPTSSSGLWISGMSSNGRILIGDAYQSKLYLLSPDQDQDGDGMSDDWEQWAISLVPELNLNNIDPNDDLDGDGTNNYGEFLLRSDPSAAPVYDPNGNEIDLRPGIDTDGDGMPNVWEWHNGLDYQNASDALLDFDRDGYTNLQEYRLNTDPRGAPAYRVREVGPFVTTDTGTPTSYVDLSSGELGNGEVTAGGNITESVTLQVSQGSSRSPSLPGRWSVQRSETEGTYQNYPSYGTATASKVAFSPGGAAIIRHSSNPIKFVYWASPSSTPITLSGVSNANNIKALNNPSLSPSGNYLAGMRQNHSNVWQPVLWKMPDQNGAPVPIALPLTPVNATFTSSSKLYVNDFGEVAATGRVGSRDCAVHWRLDPTGNPVQTPNLEPLSTGAWTSVLGITNTLPAYVAGNSVTSSGYSHAVFWSSDGTVTDIGTLGGNTSSLNFVAPSGHMAGISQVLVDNVLKYQPFIVTPLINPTTQAITSWTTLAQGDPSPNGTIVLKSITGSGELLGTLRANTGDPAIDTLWHHGRAYPLDAIVPTSSGYNLTSVDGLNAQGTLLATAWKDGYSCKILLTPDHDTDGDGLPDSYENENAFNAFVKNSPATDTDSDGLTDLEEYRNGTNPRNPDSDADGMTDGWEVSWGLLPLDPTDASLDPDNDRVSNLRESQIHTNPTGIYRLEILPTGTCPNFHSAAEDGSVIRHASGWGPNDQYELVMAPDHSGNRQVCQLAGGFYDYWEDEVTGDWSEEIRTPSHRNAGGGVVHTVFHDYLGGYDSVSGTWWEDTNQWWLSANILTDPWNDISVTDTVNDILAGMAMPSSSAPLLDWESPDGSFRAFGADFGYDLLLGPAGEFLGNLSWDHQWQFLNNRGTAAGLEDQRWVPPSGQLPGRHVVKIWLSNQTEAVTLDTTPSTTTTLSGFSDDGMALLGRSSLDPYGNLRTTEYLLDTSAGESSQIRKPGLGSESISLLSARKGRLLGTGPKPFQVTPDGTCIRLDALRIQESPIADAVPFATLYPRALTPNHIASDGRITLSTTNNSNQKVILQLIPDNDANNNGLPDDWELATGNSDALADEDGDGLINSEEFRSGGDPFNADTDGDGMNDGIEYAAGFDIANNDENHNGQNDGYEDFDDDTYINREEALCGTNARSADSRPDGTAASIVFGGGEMSSATDAPGSPNPFLAMADNGQATGAGTPVLLVRNYNFDLQSLRAATFDKQGTPGFMPGSVSEESQPPSSGGEVEIPINSRPRYYLDKTTVELVNETDDWALTEAGLADPDNEITASTSTTTGIRTTTETITQVDGTYSTESTISGSATWVWSDSGRVGMPDIVTWGDTEEYDFPEANWPNFCQLGEAQQQILSDTEARTEYSDQWDESNELSRGIGSINNSKTVTLSNEYTDAMLIGDLTTKLNAAAWLAPNGFDSPNSHYLWDPLLLKPTAHESASMQDSRYRLVSNVGSPIAPETRVIFAWKEVFIPQEDGEIEAKWVTQYGERETSGPNAGKFTTPPRYLPHPEKPGMLDPDFNRSGISAPDELAALNPGEPPLLERRFTDSHSNEQTEVTINRGKSITFQVNLEDQTKNPTLSATGSGTVTLWERQKSGKWMEHPLPFNIPAEQAAGPASHPGSYMIQGTAPGTATLHITADGHELDNATLQIRRVDLDVDSDNNGNLEASTDEENFETDVTKPGKIIMVNSTSDEDGDQIPNFADLDHAGSFTKIVLNTENLRPSDNITFNYSASDPNDGQSVTNQDGKVTYYPAPGLIRIWKKDGNTTRSLDDYIQSQFPYTQDQLGITPGQSVEFYIQDVRKISGLANIEVTTGTRSDSVLIRLANISLEMVSVDKDGNLTVDENGNPTNYKGLPSLSAPKIDGAADVTNLMIFPDGQIVGTVNVSGSVTSKACDMVDGPAGIIYDAAVVLNGTLPQKGSGEFTEDDPDAAFLPLTNSTASPTTHEPGPFRYKKNFTFSKASQYPLTEGINVLTILCKDPVTKLDGSLDIAFTLEVTEDANGINHVSIAESPEIFRQTTIGEINPYYLKVTGMDGLEDQLEHFKTQLTISGRKLKMFWDANKEMMLVEDPNYAGEALSTLMKPRERPDSPARDTFINEDDAAKRLQRLKTMAVGITDDILAFQKGYLDGLYDGGAEMVTGLGDVCVGAWGVGTNAMGYIGSTMSVGWYKLTGDEEAQASAKFNMNMFMEEQDPYVDGAFKTAKLIGEFYLYVQQSKQDALLALFSTSIFEFDAGEAAKSRLTATHDKVSFIAAEVFEMISKEFTEAKLSAYEIGHAYGRVSFEVISIIATLPAVELTILTKVAALTKLADACELIQGVAKTRWIKIIANIRAWLTEIATTEMCFVAGTLVSTAHGMTPIEQIQAGDLVWSKPESGMGVIELRPVIQTFVTHPHELWALTYRSNQSGTEDETITGTAEHPFWTEETRGFVPMAELKAGMTLLLANGQSAEVMQVAMKRGPPGETYTTYNFEVAEFHTYFVGRSGVWVHNSGMPCERFFSILDRMRRIMKAGGYITGNGSVFDEWMLLQCTLVKIQDRVDIEHTLLASIIRRFRNENLGGGLIDIPSIPYSQAGNFIKYSTGPNHGVQFHHWWPREWLPDALKNGVNHTHGLTFPLATPVLHTGGPYGLQPMLNRFMRDQLGGSLAQAKSAFLAKTFSEQRNLLRQFYETAGFKMPDFTSPGLID